MMPTGVRPEMDGHQFGDLENLVEIKAREKFNRRHKGIRWIFRGLNFSRNADIGQIGHFWMGTNQYDDDLLVGKRIFNYTIKDCALAIQ